MVDGEKLIDRPEEAAAFGNNLVQTWEQTSFRHLNAHDPADVAIYNQIKESLDAYEGEKEAFRANLRLKLKSVGFDAKEIGYLLG